MRIHKGLLIPLWQQKSSQREDTLVIWTFASDRSHMLNEDGNYLHPPPTYQCIKTKGFLYNVIADSQSFQSAEKQNVLDVAHKLGATTFLSLAIKTNLTAMFNQTVDGRHDKKSFRNEALYKSRSKMDNGDKFLKVRVNIYHGGEIITAGVSPIVKFDNEASNGIVHIMSLVMFWPARYGSVAQIVNIPITTFMAYGLLDGGLTEQLNSSQLYNL
ncbi:NTAQ1 [Mytilus coruscus]|uniref:Protein N-terminal glutamine amidohydrolase n=1 Tax=Mytilus coruscus TaxID=42192 RepID=A0A6J8A074_MYTCO|nr:NTAQ1 [Mytilus coruscus]